MEFGLQELHHGKWRYKMAIVGTYIFDKDEGETIDELYERRIETAYYMIDNIHLSSYVGIGDGTVLNVDVSVFKDKDNRDNRESKIDMLLTNESFLFEIEKNIDVGKIWDYCYIKIKDELRNRLELKLVQYEETDELLEKYVIKLEDI
jgi:hypothetical protein